MTPQYYNLFFFHQNLLFTEIHLFLCEFQSIENYFFKFYILIFIYLSLFIFYFEENPFFFCFFLENFLDKYSIHTQVVIYFSIPDIFIDFVIEENATYG